MMEKPPNDPPKQPLNPHKRIYQKAEGEWTNTPVVNTGGERPKFLPVRAEALISEEIKLAFQIIENARSASDIKHYPTIGGDMNSESIKQSVQDAKQRYAESLHHANVLQGGLNALEMNEKPSGEFISEVTKMLEKQAGVVRQLHKDAPSGAFDPALERERVKLAAYDDLMRRLEQMP